MEIMQQIFIINLLEISCPLMIGFIHNIKHQLFIIIIAVYILLIQYQYIAIYSK